MKILGRGIFLGSGPKFWVLVKILGLAENFGFGSGQKNWFWVKFWVGMKILGSGDNFGFG